MLFLLLLQAKHNEGCGTITMWSIGSKCPNPQWNGQNAPNLNPKAWPVTIVRTSSQILIKPSFNPGHSDQGYCYKNCFHLRYPSSRFAKIFGVAQRSPSKWSKFHGETTSTEIALFVDQVGLWKKEKTCFHIMDSNWQQLESCWVYCQWYNCNLQVQRQQVSINKIHRMPKNTSAQTYGFKVKGHSI